MLTEIQKKFVKIEKDIDPNVPGSPAYEIAGLLKSYKLKRLKEEQEAARWLEKNRLLTEKRLLGRGDLMDGQKKAALKRADERLQKGQVKLAIGQIETDLIPIITAPDGYIDLLRPWWEEVGRHLPESERGLSQTKQNENLKPDCRSTTSFFLFGFLSNCAVILFMKRFFR